MGLIAGQGAAGAPPGTGQGWPVITDQVNVAGNYNVKSPLDTVVLLPCPGMPFISAVLLPIGTVTGGGTVVTEFSMNGGKSWAGLYGVQGSINTGGSFGALAGNATAVATTGQQYFFQAPSGTTHVRLRLTVAMTGSGSMNVFLGASCTGARTDIFIAGSSATVNTNTLGIANTTISATNIVYQASQTSAIVNGTTTRTTTTGLGIYHTLNFLLNITAAGAVTGTLQIFCEDSQDGGTTWDDMWASNPFVFGSALTTQRFSVNGFIASSITQGSAQAIETLAAGTARQGPFGDRVRIREVVTLIAGSPTGVTYTINGVAHL